MKGVPKKKKIFFRRLRFSSELAKFHPSNPAGSHSRSDHRLDWNECSNSPACLWTISPPSLEKSVEKPFRSPEKGPFSSNLKGKDRQNRLSHPTTIRNSCYVDNEKLLHLRWMDGLGAGKKRDFMVHHLGAGFWRKLFTDCYSTRSVHKLFPYFFQGLRRIQSESKHQNLHPKTQHLLLVS